MASKSIRDIKEAENKALQSIDKTKKDAEKLIEKAIKDSGIENLGNILEKNYGGIGGTMKVLEKKPKLSKERIKKRVKGLINIQKNTELEVLHLFNHKTKCMP